MYAERTAFLGGLEIKQDLPILYDKGLYLDRNVNEHQSTSDCQLLGKKVINLLDTRLKGYDTHVRRAR